MVDYKYVTKKTDLPADPHWVILVYGSVSTPGYDPGDPPGSQNIVEYLAFTDKSKLEDWIARNETTTYSRKTYSVIEAFPKVAKTKVVVEF